MTSYPFWVTAATLPSRPETYSYSSNPEKILYGETANQPCTVSIPPINGELPPGTSIEFVDGQLQIIGQIQGSIDGKTYEFTLRLSNSVLSTDRTFSITVSNPQDRLTWITSNTIPLGYYYEAGPFTFNVLAENQPLKTINYNLASPRTWTEGLTIDSSTGLVILDLTWRPNFNYTTLDYVLNNTRLYQCVVAGTSGLSNGPISPGSQVVDSSEPGWLPNRYYTINSIVNNDNGKLYVCLSTGFSGNGTGPTGTSSFIPDGSTVSWRYIGQAAVWDQVPPGTSVPLNFGVIAATDTQTLPNTFSIDLLSRPFQPIWQTPAGQLARLAPRDNFAYSLEVFDPDFQGVAFSSIDLPSWLNLGQLGELWGQAPLVLSSTVYSFSVLASDGTTAVSRSFSIEVAQSAEQISWITNNSLGTISDGDFSSIQFVATTTRPGASVSYGLRGGAIPLNTAIESSTGMLSGFVDFHAQSKTYYFEVAAFDGTETNVNWFELRVESQNREKFLNISIPITGYEKLQFTIDNGPSLIAPEFLFREQDKNWSRNDSPEISVVSGLKYSNIEQVKNSLQQWLTEFEVSYGHIDTSNDPSLQYQTLFVTIRDSNSVEPWQPFTQYHSNERVSTSSGLQLVAVIGGTSGGYPEPQVGGNDGSVVWQIIGTPNRTSPRPIALPWYPDHLYQQTQTVQNFGNVYKAINSGKSSSGLGPEGLDIPVSDGEIQWTVDTTVGPNVAYPASIHNIRTESISTLGYANSKGSNAQAVANLSAITGGITSITILSAGTGYYSQPVVSVDGDGSGAQLEALLHIVGTTVMFSTPGFVVGASFSVSQGVSVNGLLGTIQVSQVSATGVVTQVSVTDPGTWTHFPKANITFTDGVKQLVVFFDLGIKSVSILKPGTNYTRAVVGFSGTELLPPWQATWSKKYVLSIPLASITLAGAKKFKDSVFMVNPYQGRVIEVKQLKFSIQGLIWTGNTTFDSDVMCWDNQQTRLVEFDPVTETLFDSGFEMFDNDVTQFDRGQMTIVPYSQTVFDEDTTITDFYSTLFDARSGASSSRFSKSWLINFGKPWN